MSLSALRNWRMSSKFFQSLIFIQRAPSPQSPGLPSFPGQARPADNNVHPGEGSGQTNHRQISGRLTWLGSTSRFFQNSITARVMTGSAGTQSYSDHCGATVIEFEGCREQCWNRVRRAIAVTVSAPKGWGEDHAAHCACTHTHANVCSQMQHKHLFCQKRLL